VGLRAGLKKETRKRPVLTGMMMMMMMMMMMIQYQQQCSNNNNNNNNNNKDDDDNFLNIPANPLAMDTILGLSKART
jgi:hypothetical protein